MQLGLGDGQDVAETTFCRSSGHTESWELKVVITIAVLLFLLPFLMYHIFLFSKKIQLFPLKARGPRLAILQMIYFVLLNLIPLAVEGLVSAGVHWRDESKKYVARSFLKSLYFLTRVSVNLIYVHRTLLIYANWRVPLDKLYNRFWAVFGNETRSMIVAVADQAFLMLQSLLLIVFTALSDVLVTGFSSLDIYRESNETWYIVFNPTLVEIAENFVLIGCLYVLR